MFETFYNSPIQHPGLLWFFNLIGTGFGLIMLRAGAGGASSRLRRFILFWALVSGIDAWLSANTVFGIGNLQAPFSSIVPFLFVWAGDFRIFLAMEYFSQGFPAQTPRTPWLKLVFASLLVPILAGVLTRGQEARILFLVYEAMFLVWIGLYVRLTGLHANASARKIRNLSWAFYSLWVLADLLILFLPENNRDYGFAVRVLPNLIYYGAFGWVCVRAFR
jgi:hypothetical protein